MTCTLINEQIDDYIDGAITGDELAQLDAHISECASCEGIAVAARELQARLREYGDSTMPQPDAAFFAGALIKAAQQGTKRQRNRWMMTGFGGAIAAALAIFIVSSMFFTAPQIDESAAPGVTMALEEPRTVNLVFSSAEALANATMTVTLPPGVEIEGFAGQREITWMTSLKEGRNVLPLTLIATSPIGGELLATLRHENDDRSFRVQVTVTG